jgi:glucose/mannose-6-phosphate isomerase
MMDQAIRELNKQFEYEPVVENGPIKSAERIIIAGMGGSHLAADLLKIREACSDLIIHKNYGLPCVPHDDFSKSLLIANSYSGNTEEIVDFFNQGIENNLNVVAVSTGGKLIEIAKEKGLPYIQIPTTEIQPRSALGFTLRALLKAAGLESLLESTKELATSLDPGALEEKGKELAEKLKGHIPIIYSSAKNEPIASNWKAKINETGKIPAFYNVFPELNHNEMIGFDTKISDVGLAEKFYFVFLKDTDDHNRVIKRMEITEKLLRDRNLPVEVQNLEETDKFHKAFTSLLIADWTAYWIAKMNNVDPEEVPLVEEFKKLI